MKTTIEKIWRGELSPWCDQESRVKKEEMLVELMERHRCDLSKRLDETGRDSLQKLIDVYDELLCGDREDAFIKGFSLGAKIVAEALVEE